ncbi:NUDIX hydrolase [Sporofaciens musculi]|uniref:NUDIX hydrolase n=1 Tax=Sporofaciens musculi TaxID=2681861 RepID=UPI002582BEA0|nr:NUDIX hydrolase [Sporofaciens musculi]
MPSFLEDISRFRGTEERNAKGETLEEFLKAYDPTKYESPSCTTDALIFAHSGKPAPSLESLSLLMVKRSNHPCIGTWALPGGFVNMRENLSDTARRELEEETGVKGLVMEQLATYGSYDRDPRSRVITTAYMALVNEKDVKVKAGDDAADAAWCKVGLKLVSSKQEGGKVTNSYALSLENENKGLATKALVEEHIRTDGVIQEQNYIVIEQGMTAADHAAIITQALLILKKRLENHLVSPYFL